MLFPVRLTAITALALSIPAAAAAVAKPSPADRELVVMVDTANDMPMSRFEQYRLVDGIQKDLGDALGRILGRKVRFLALPRKRIAMALEKGDADVLCGYKPDWLPGNFAWSQPFLTQVEVVLTDRGAVRPPVVGALASQPIGTVFGYKYPKLEEELGDAFIRADGPSVDLNLAKLAAGRLHHMSAVQSWFDYRLRQGSVKVPLHPPLVIAVHHTRCALSMRSPLKLRDLDHALDKISTDGTLSAIEARYK